MVKHILLYIEGGRSRSKDVQMRKGFSLFFRDLKRIADERDISFRCITFQARQHTYEKFCYGLSQDPDAFHVLLVDSEEPVSEVGKCWKHLKERRGDEWECPAGATEENCHLMAQALEAWFFADPDALTVYYKQKFNRAALGNRTNVEEIPKAEHIPKLEAATKATQKGRYDKTDHAPDLLAMIDAVKVRQRAPHCDRLFKIIGDKMDATD